jgi:hypothetical protein
VASLPQVCITLLRELQQNGAERVMQRYAKTLKHNAKGAYCGGEWLINDVFKSNTLFYKGD